MEATDRSDHKMCIQAARHWLDKAASSLEAENELRSDLQVMLAEAERCRAKASLPPEPSGCMRTCPLVASLCVAAGYIFFAGGDDEKGMMGVSVSEDGTPLYVQENKKVAGKTGEHVESLQDGESMPLASMRIAPTVNEETLSMAKERLSSSSDGGKSDVQSPAQTDEADLSARKETREDRRNVPDTDVQQLMQRAACILRK